MVSACVLICCESGKYPEVANKVARIKDVVRAFPASGRWDVIAEIDALDYTSLTNTALRINREKNVRATETLVEAPI